MVDTAPRHTAAPGDPAGGSEKHTLRRDHPTFVALSGFFSGVVTIIVVPTIFAGLLHVFVSQDRAESLYPLVLLTLVIPIVLLAIPRTRLYGGYLLIGILSTAVVVAGVAGAVFYILYSTQSR